MDNQTHPIGKRQRRGWRWIVIGLLGFSLAFTAFMVAPLIFDFRSPSPAGGENRLASEGMTVSPGRGATRTQVRLLAEDVPAVTDVRLLGGQSLDDLQELTTVRTSGEGTLAIQVSVPEWAERGEPFYFAIEADGERLGFAMFDVIVLEDVVPGGV